VCGVRLWLVVVVVVVVVDCTRSDEEGFISS
jgi:hypothetical protein